jgi:hypothetical protein
MRGLALQLLLAIGLILMGGSACWADDCCSVDSVGQAHVCPIKAEGRAIPPSCDECCLRPADPPPSPPARARLAGWDPATPVAVQSTTLSVLSVNMDTCQPDQLVQRPRPGRSQGWSSLLFALPPPA